MGGWPRQEKPQKNTPADFFAMFIILKNNSPKISQEKKIADQ